MPTDYEELPVTWDEIKADSVRLVTGSSERKGEKRAVREYLQHTVCEDPRAKENAILGYN